MPHDISTLRRQLDGARRGDLMIVTSGDDGEPPPALIVQADAQAEHPLVMMRPLARELHEAPLLRVTVEPGEGMGLRLRS